jgi:hypothetical protein
MNNKIQQLLISIGIPPATGCWPETRSEKPAAKTLSPVLRQMKLIRAL